MQTLAPFGLRPSYHPTGIDRGTSYPIASGYATAIFKGDPVILSAAGTITAGAAASDLIGVFNGVEYTDALGKPTYSNFWPAGQVVFANSVTTMWVWDTPDMVYDVQANGSVAAGAIGNQSDIVMGAGSVQTGLSTTVLSAALAGVGVQGQFRVVDYNRDPSNAAGDPYTVVQVKIARHQYIANKVAI